MQVMLQQTWEAPGRHVSEALFHELAAGINIARLSDRVHLTEIGLGRSMVGRHTQVKVRGKQQRRATKNLDEQDIIITHPILSFQDLIL